MHLIEQVVWDGVAIVGGGVTGLLTARKVAELGIPALVIESRQLGGGQTAQAHGWLHRGYVFRDLERSEAATLREGASWWQEQLTDLDFTPIARHGVIGVSESRTARLLTDKWDAFGLPYERVDPVGNELPWAYRTPEWSVSTTAALHALMSFGPQISYSRGRVIALRTDGVDATASLVVDRDGRQSLLKARAVIVAAGTGSPHILNEPPATASISLRRSHMLVLRTDVDLPAALALPEQASKGLFGVRRVGAGRGNLLFSNFLSYAGRDDSPVARRTWMRSITRAISTFLPEVTAGEEARWGSYPTVKAEVSRNVPLGVPGQGILPTAASNAIAVLPGKFTAAPVVARFAAENAASLLRPCERGTSIAVDPAPRFADEDWSMTPLARVPSQKETLR